MKKFVAVLSAAAMMTSLAACGSTADTANTAASSANTAASAAKSTADTVAADSYKVAIVQQLDHASLDEIRVAIEKELDAKAAEKGITIEYKDFNGQNDATTLNQIGTEVVADGYDAIIPIGTTAAQQMAATAQATETPVIYGTVSYPETAGLTGISYVTGTSDALNVELLLDLRWSRWACSTPPARSTAPPRLRPPRPIWTARGSPTWTRRATPPMRSWRPSTPCWTRWTRSSPPQTMW